MPVPRNRYDSLLFPPIEGLQERVGSKFLLATLAARRSKEITNYLCSVGGGPASLVPPQVVTTAHKPLTIALEEIAAGKIQAVVVEDADPDPPEDPDPDEPHLRPA